MLNSIIRLALNNRLFVVAFASFIIVYGSITTMNLPIDVFPDITKPTVTIMTESHGMAPEEVESRVTYPIESYLNGIPGVERIRSQSGIGLSVIYLEFEWGTDIYRNRQLVQEKLTLSQEKLPQDIKPVMGPVGSLMGQIQQIAVTSENNEISPIELRSFAEWVLRPRLMTISGVAQVISIGGGLKQYQILVSAEKINRYQLSIEDIDSKLSQISPNTTGGFLEKDGQELLVRNIAVLLGFENYKELTFSEKLEHEHDYEMALAHNKKDHEFLYKETEIQSAVSVLSASSLNRNWVPKLDAFASYNQFNEREKDFANAEDRTESRVGVRVSLSLGEAFESYKEAASLKKEALSAQKISELKKKEIDIHVSNEMAELELLHSLVHTAEENILRAEKYYKLTLSEYARGVKNSPDVLGASEKLFEIKKKRIEIVRDFQIAKAHILSKIGK
ncbi:MAG: efflux RND transporter permease subunit [Pseudobdellovibrio sp.]